MSNFRDSSCRTWLGTMSERRSWAGKRNGDLLELALAAGFEILVTGDKNLEFQQNLENSGLVLVVLVAPSNKLEDLLPRIPGALAAITAATPGEVVRVDAFTSPA